MSTPPIPLIRPFVTFGELADAFRDILDRGVLTQGPYSHRLREKIATFVGVKHVFLTSSATTALYTALKMLGVERGDEVLVSDFSFPATVNVVHDAGATPRFVDALEHTYNMDPELLENAIGVRTKAVIFVEALGNPTGAHRIREICSRRGIPLVEDAACALGSSERGRMCGSFGDVGCLSFHPRKLLTTGEGGAILTDDDRYAEWLTKKLAHGSTFNDGKREFADFGYNFRLPEMAAAMGLAQLPKLSAIIDERIAIRNFFIESLRPLGWVAQACDSQGRFNVQSLTFTLPPPIDRRELFRHLADRGIESTFGTYSLSNTRHSLAHFGNGLPVSRKLEDRTITLPCFPSVPKEEILDAIADFHGGKR